MNRSNRWRAVLAGRPLAWVLALAALAVAALLWYRHPARPSVLIITIDTLRADALNAGDTPALMELAARGVRFVRARTPVPLTLPAHVSLLSGLGPRAHGVRTNTAPPLAPRGQRGFDLLAEEFRDAGYATAAFVASGVLHPRYGLDAGFDQFRHPGAPAKGAPGYPERDAREQVRLVRTWFESRPVGRPFFVWVHLWDPHAPYFEYAGDERRDGTDAASDAPAQLYRGEVRKADWAVERLLELVDLADTVVVVTADHGESLGEHGEPTHGHLCYGATMDVPLLLAGPQLPRGRRERRVASLTDVTPTLRCLCGLKARSTSGRDLLRLPDRRVLVGESLHAYRLYGWAQQSVAYEGRFSLIDAGPRQALFDRVRDPGEREGLALLTPEPDALAAAAYERLDRAILAYKARAGEGAAGGLAPLLPIYGTVTIPQTEFLNPERNRVLPDVQARLARTEAALARLNAAISARRRDLVLAAMPAIEQLEADDGANPALALARGRALLLVLERRAQARRAFHQAIARGYPTRALAGLLAQAAER